METHWPSPRLQLLRVFCWHTGESQTYTLAFAVFDYRFRDQHIFFGLSPHARFTIFVSLDGSAPLMLSTFFPP